MAYQYNYDANGKAVGVFVPINEWERITESLQKLKRQQKTGTKTTTLKSIKKGMEQVKQIERKKIKSIPIQKLLDEL